MTLVVLMGVKARGAIAGRLIARGWSAATPAALLFGASQPGGFTRLTTLGELVASGGEDVATDLPGVLVIGEVVSLAGAIGHLIPAPQSQSISVPVVPNAPNAKRSL
jgi:siroheme synthase